MSEGDQPWKRTVLLGHVGGVAVRAHWSVLVMMALVASLLAGESLPAEYPGHRGWEYGAVGAVAALVFLAGLVAHEAAHAVVARRHGVAVSGVTLWMLGGVTEVRSEPSTPRAELRIAGAGPLVSLLLGVGFAVLAATADVVGAPSLVVGGIVWLAGINVLLAVFNALPGAPLDGGRLLRAALWRWRGDRAWASVTAARGGHALGVTLLVLGGMEFVLRGLVSGLWLAMVGWFVMAAAREEANQADADGALAGVRVADVMSPFPEAAPADLPVAEFVGAHLRAYRHSTLPLVRDGRPTGLVVLSDLRAPGRADRTLQQVALPMARVPVAAPGEPLASLLPRLNRAAHGRALVVDDGQLVGIVSPLDVTRAVELA